MWIDSHCHLDAPEFDADRDAVWRQAEAVGVRKALAPAIGLANCDAVAACCARYSRGNTRLFPAWGIHPLFVMTARETEIDGLSARVAVDRPVAIGEIGLDGYTRDVDFPRQEFFLAKQLKLAADFDLPVVLHARRAVDRVLEHLHRIRVKGGIAHAFNGSRQQADTFLRMGFKLGFGGALTYSGSTRIRKLAVELPEEALVLETDAPDIPPAWLRGKRNTPSELPAIGAVLAELRGLDIARLAAITHANTLAVLREIRSPP
jgi:TatD DNase family protein